MRKQLVASFFFISVIALQGCTTQNKSNSLTTASNVSNGSKESQLPYFKLCLKNAEMLVNLDKKYNKDISDLHKLMGNAKEYALLSEDLSENVKSTTTPFFEYKINYKCNHIAQLLIDELNNNSKEL